MTVRESSREVHWIQLLQVGVLRRQSPCVAQNLAATSLKNYVDAPRV